MKQNNKQSIDDATLERVSQVARIKLTESEKQEFRSDLNGILGYFSQIGEIQEKGRELYYVKDGNAVQRKDEPVESKEAEGMRSQFTKGKNGLMLAPKTL